MLSLIGNRFGRWLVIAKLAPDKFGASQWLCRCVCGVEKSVRGVPLRRGKSSSCQLCAQNPRRKRPFEAVYTTICAVARREHFGVMTYEEFLQFVEQHQCFYCAREVVWPAHNIRSNPGHTRYNLDRKDNDKGYEANNVVVCCKTCNFMRGNRFTFEEMLLLMPALRQISKEKQCAAMYSMN